MPLRTWTILNAHFGHRGSLERKGTKFHFSFPHMSNMTTKIDHPTTNRLDDTLPINPSCRQMGQTGTWIIGWNHSNLQLVIWLLDFHIFSEQVGTWSVAMNSLIAGLSEVGLDVGGVWWGTCRWTMRFAAVVFSTVWCLFVLYNSHAGLWALRHSRCLVCFRSDSTWHSQTVNVYTTSTAQRPSMLIPWENEPSFASFRLWSIWNKVRH